tara:strand:- start:649 stop:2238 length:1590 start_codon:yes stop_codon:yes gene_type:complete
MSKINNLIFLSILFSFVFGKRYALLSLPSVPGYIIDFVIIFCLLMTVLKNYTTIFSFKNFKFLILVLYSIIFFIFYFLNSDSSVINEIGQDSVLLIYPLILYLIAYNNNIKFDKVGPISKWLLFSYSILLITDFIIERSIIITRFLGLNFELIEPPWFNLVRLKPTESIFFLCSLIFFDIKDNSEKFSFVYIFPGIYFGLTVPDSRTILFSSILFFIINYLENRNTFVLKSIVFIFVGIFISASSVTITSDQKLLEKQIDRENSDVGMGRVRNISIDCLFENLTLQRNKQDCEISKWDINKSYSIDNIGLLFESENQGFKIENSDIIRKKLEELNDLYVGLTDIPLKKLVEGCLSNSSDLVTKIDCEEFIYLFNELVQLRNNAYDELCGDNIDWRINLWKKSIVNDNTNITNLLLGNGIGYSIPQKLVSDNQLPIECYSESISSSRPLRSSHNTLLTFFYRFGLINFLILISFISFGLFRLFRNRDSSIIILGLAISFLDPILDNPLCLFVFCILFFGLLNKNNYKNSN